MIKRNQLGVLFNSFQGKYKKVLCVCSAGCLRSPTAAHILSSPPWNFNTRAVGLSKEYAIVPITDALIAWADIIIVMDSDMVKQVNDMQVALASNYDSTFEMDYKQVFNLEIEDDYDYRHPDLVKIMTAKFTEMFGDGNEA